MSASSISTNSVRDFAFAMMSFIGLLRPRLVSRCAVDEILSDEPHGTFGGWPDPDDGGMRIRRALSFRRNGINKPNESMLVKSVARASCSRFGQL